MTNMTQSTVNGMTAFSRQEHLGELGTVVWEVRSVNHRFLDLSIRLPEAFNQLEMQTRELVSKRLNRGRIECTLTFNTTIDTEQKIVLNTHLVEQLVHASHEVAKLIDNPSPLNLADILSWPGVIQTDENQLDAINLDKIKPFIMQTLNVCLDELIVARQREGKSLKSILLQRLDSIQKEINKIKKALPTILKETQDKLKQQFIEYAVKYEPERLEQEMLLLIQKADVEEELDRLQMHIKEVRNILNQGGVVGRRLDFLMQELNREANTIGSKSIAAVVTSSAVELKVFIEQMREQIQNLE